jgi:hypothetical protein
MEGCLFVLFVCLIQISQPTAPSPYLYLLGVVQKLKFWVSRCTQFIF